MSVTVVDSKRGPLTTRSERPVAHRPDRLDLVEVVADEPRILGVDGVSSSGG